VSAGLSWFVRRPGHFAIIPRVSSIFNAQTQWIADHETSHNIQIVLHQGDLTNNNDTTEFGRAKTAMSTLDTASVSMAREFPDGLGQASSGTRYTDLGIALSGLT